MPINIDSVSHVLKASFHDFFPKFDTLASKCNVSNIKQSTIDYANAANDSIDSRLAELPLRETYKQLTGKELTKAGEENLQTLLKCTGISLTSLALFYTMYLLSGLSTQTLPSTKPLILAATLENVTLYSYDKTKALDKTRVLIEYIARKGFWEADADYIITEFKNVFSCIGNKDCYTAHKEIGQFIVKEALKSVIKDEHELITKELIELLDEAAVQIKRERNI